MFLIYIDYINTRIRSNRGAGDTKIGRVIKTDQDARQLQEDLDRLYEWSVRWQVEINIKKSKFLSASRRSRHVDHTFNNTNLCRKKSEIDLGV